jgi:glycine cleavage system protein P-like pyridoxal-binding family
MRLACIWGFPEKGDPTPITPPKAESEVRAAWRKMRASGLPKTYERIAMFGAGGVKWMSAKGQKSSVENEKHLAEKLAEKQAIMDRRKMLNQRERVLKLEPDRAQKAADALPNKPAIKS